MSGPLSVNVNLNGAAVPPAAAAAPAAVPASIGGGAPAAAPAALPPATPAAAPTPAATPAPAATPPAPLGLNQINETNVPANVYNELMAKIAEGTEAGLKAVDDRKREWFEKGRSSAAQFDLADTINANVDVLNALPDQYKTTINSFATQHKAAVTADPVYGAADQALFDSAKTIVGLSLSFKRPPPAAAADPTATKNVAVPGATGLPVPVPAAAAGPLTIDPNATPVGRPPVVPTAGGASSGAGTIWDKLTNDIASINAQATQSGIRPIGNLSTVSHARNAGVQSVRLADVERKTPIAA